MGNKTKSLEVINAESEYLAKINDVFSLILLAHIPVALLAGWIYETGIFLGLIFSLLICSLPLYLNYFTKNYVTTAISNGISLMFYSGLLIHLTRGMIETHFHVFVSLACLIVYANPIVILAATGTIALHHVGFYFFLPESIFNYQASFSIVLIHAGYVIIETIPCLWIAQKFNNYIIKQGVTIAKIDLMFSKMDQMISELKESSKITNQDTLIQSQSIFKTAEAVNEIGEMTNSTSKNADESKNISHLTKSSAEIGKELMEDLLLAFKKIKESNGALSKQIEFYNKQLSQIVINMQQIKNKTNVINDIVFQTKLLSFNASVESARAGEHGRGFAIVAEEVGNLANMSGAASKEINELISKNVDQVTQIAESTKSNLESYLKTSQESIHSGEEKSNTTFESFTQLKNHLTNLNLKVQEISEASNQQTKGIQQITSAIQELELINNRATKTQNTSSNISHNLSLLSEDLKQLVNELKGGEKRDEKIQQFNSNEVIQHKLAS